MQHQVRACMVVCSRWAVLHASGARQEFRLWCNVDTKCQLYSNRAIMQLMRLRCSFHGLQMQEGCRLMSCGAYPWSLGPVN